MVAFIDVRDRYNYAASIKDRKTASSDTISQQEAQLAAMLENAKTSTWQDNIRNAADAQERFMLPGRDVDAGRDAPTYLKQIDERSGEILQQERERRDKETQDKSDASKTRFW